MSDIVKLLNSDAAIFYEFSCDNGKLLRDAAAEITRLRAELAGKWLPIETPPQIGELVLLFENGQIWLAWFWEFNPSNDRKVNDFEVSRWKPTHWKPLPTPPQPEVK